MAQRARKTPSRRGLALARLPTPRSGRVFVLPPRAGLVGLRLGRAGEQERVVRRDERIGRGHRVGVVDASVLAREGDEAGGLAQAVLELRSDLPAPVLEPPGRV